MATDFEERATTPWHLWAVGALALLWNGFGGYDYLMTRTKGAAYIRDMMPGIDADKMMAYINAFPIWVSVGWGLGVWGAVLGSILLLARHRWAVPAFALSLLGAVASIGFQLVHPIELPQAKQGYNAVVPYLVIAIAALLYVYARAQRAKGVLR